MCKLDRNKEAFALNMVKMTKTKTFDLVGGWMGGGDPNAYISI